MTRRRLLIAGAVLACGTAAGIYFALAPPPSERLAAALAEKRWGDAEALARAELTGAGRDAQADLYRALGRALERQGEHTEALEVYRAARGLRPLDPNLRQREAIQMIRIGEAREQRGEVPEALNLYREAIDLAPEIPHGHHALVDLLAAQHELDEVIAALDAAMQSVPQDVDLRLQLAWRLASHPDPDKRDGERAIALAHETLLHDRTPESLDTYAVALAALGEFEGAIRYELDAIDLAGGDKALHFEERRRRVGGFTKRQPYIEVRTGDEKAQGPER